MDNADRVKPHGLGWGCSKGVGRSWGLGTCGNGKGRQHKRPVCSFQKPSAVWNGLLG